MDNTLKVTRLQVSQLQSNCYIVFDSETLDCIVIDPGDDADYITQKLLDFSLTPQALISTHGHFDHINAALELQLAFNILFYLPEKDNYFLESARKTTIHFTNVDPGPPPKPTLIKTETKELTIGNLRLTIIPIPGHTPGSIALYLKNASCVFVGDLVFADGTTGEWRHKYGDRKQLFKSIEKILKLPGETIVYTGHGEETTVQELKRAYV